MSILEASRRAWLAVAMLISSIPLFMDAASLNWVGSTSTDWGDATNWDLGTLPIAGDVVYIASGNVDFGAGTADPNALRAVRLNGGTLTLSGGTLSSAFNPSWDTHIEGTLNHTGTDATFNELEIGRNGGSNGFYALQGGSLKIARTLGGYSLHIGSNKSGGNAGNGELQISGGSFITRTGAKLGDAALTGTGTFTVLGTGCSQIGLGANLNDIDAQWEQNAGSILRVGVDYGGVTTIVVHDSSSDTTGTSATFASGSLLDVDYYGSGSGGGTWTVLEVQGGDVIDNGLAFAAGVDTSIWSFRVDNSGFNGRLLLTAVGTPNAVNLTVGNTLNQQMRYGMDYERLWYWTGGLNASEKDTVARWSTVDCDIDYVRVAINSKYELTEGNYDLSAYTSKIWPMMHDMQDANPDIKFFASPRPLDEAVSGARWQPYPTWITGDNGSTFNFDPQKCAEYLERYILLMKSEGFKISYLDLTNEWNYLNGTDVRDISQYLEANLAPTDMPLLVAPSAWSYSQGASWLWGVNTTGKRDALDIAACHNTNKT